MKATDFEYRHQTLLHSLLVGAAVSTYFLNPDDIVWALVRHHTNSAFLEQATFGAGTLLLLASAVLETWASAYAQPLQHPLLLSRLLFALVLGLLVPLPGTILIVAGEAVLVFRLLVRDRYSATAAPAAEAKWGAGLGWAAAKWGFLASMIVFTWTRRDRIAEIGGAISFLVWLAQRLAHRSLLGSPAPYED